MVFGPHLWRGLDHATDSLRFAALARSNGQDGKEKGCTEGAKRPPRSMSVFSKRDFENVKVVPKTLPNHRNDAGTVPLEARSMQRLKKQARTAPEGRKGCQKGAMAAQGSQKGAKKKTEFTKNTNF